MRPSCRAAILATACGLSGCGSGDGTPADWKSHSIGAGPVSVRAPADYQQALEPDDTLVLLPPGDPGITLRLSVHTLPADAAADFVREQAEKNRLPVTEQGGKVILTEAGGGEEQGIKVERRFWQIGFENVVVVMSATVIEEKKDTPAVQACLEHTVPLMIQSLRK
jgi:hypothetical protein